MNKTDYCVCVSYTMHLQGGERVGVGFRTFNMCVEGVKDTEEVIKAVMDLLVLENGGKQVNIVSLSFYPPTMGSPDKVQSPTTLEDLGLSCD